MASRPISGISDSVQVLPYVYEYTLMLHDDVISIFILCTGYSMYNGTKNPNPTCLPEVT